MIPSDLLKKIKKVEIKTRRLVQSSLGGQYQSAFKGQGISFSEVRPYQFGDDTRLIDWKVSARMMSPFIKLFEEERELTVILAVDISRSHVFGSVEQTKLDRAAELAAVLGFSAVHSQDKVGLLLFSDQIESFIPPQKGRRHMLRLLRDIYYKKPVGKGTQLSLAAKYLAKALKKKALIFLISDFIDPHFSQNMSFLSRKHDLVPLVLYDRREMNFPNVGLVSLEDPESGERLYVDTRTESGRQSIRDIVYSQILEIERFFATLSIQSLLIDTDSSYMPVLQRYFSTRNKH